MAKQIINTRQIIFKKNIYEKLIKRNCILDKLFARS